MLIYIYIYIYIYILVLAGVVATEALGWTDCVSCLCPVGS